MKPFHRLLFLLYILSFNIGCKNEKTSVNVEPLDQKVYRSGLDLHPHKYSEGLKHISKSDCKTCHSKTIQMIGPAYSAIAEKYKNTPETMALLSKKVKYGGSGIWGEQVMTPHPDLADDVIHQMVSYILSLDEENEQETSEVDETKTLAMAQFVSEAERSLWSTETRFAMNQKPDHKLDKMQKSPNMVENNTLTETEKKAGWELLFDGKSLNGWHNFKKKSIGKSWVVHDEAIHLDARKGAGQWQATDGGDIITDKTYENFEFVYDWKISNCGNSGVMFNVVESEKYDYAWQTGPEMQVLDNACHPDSRYVNHKAGDLYDLIECKYLTVKPAGEWNKAKIKSSHGKVDFWLNEVNVVSFTMHDELWRKMVAKSKFKDMSDFGLAKGGHLALQDHGDKVWFRNLKIRKIK